MSLLGDAAHWVEEGVVSLFCGVVDSLSLEDGTALTVTAMVSSGIITDAILAVEIFMLPSFLFRNHTISHTQSPL
jgi:hypothetical protein